MYQDGVEMESATVSGDAGGNEETPVQVQHAGGTCTKKRRVWTKSYFSLRVQPEDNGFF